MTFRFWRGMLVIALGVGWGCSTGPGSPSPLPTGSWGGDHITMTVADTATHIELDCAHGDIPGALTVDARNQFTVVGTFVREHGGPIRADEVPDSHPATYTGSVTANIMRLSVRLIDTGEIIGTFALMRGTTGRVVKCL